MSRRTFLLQSAAIVATTLAAPAVFAQQRKLRFGVGPFMPTMEDTKRAFTPLFSYIAKQMGAPDFELAVSSDWAGLAVAMGSGQLDAAWMGPWGYVIANNATDCQAIATVKYDDKPTYHAIIIGRPDMDVSRFPDDTRGRSISFADLGSTSGWLIPTYYAARVWKIDPKAFWKYSEGAAHPANEIAVAAFLDRKIAFSRIAVVVEDVLNQGELPEAPRTLEDVLRVDEDARSRATRILEPA